MLGETFTILNVMQFEALRDGDRFFYLNRLSPALADRLEDLLLELHDRYERRVSLVGWSAGGIYAREMARALPGHTRSVITLGSPFRGHPASTRVPAISLMVAPSGCRRVMSWSSSCSSG